MFHLRKCFKTHLETNIGQDRVSSTSIRPCFIQKSANNKEKYSISATMSFMHKFAKTGGNTGVNYSIVTLRNFFNIPSFLVAGWGHLLFCIDFSVLALVTNASTYVKSMQVNGVFFTLCEINSFIKENWI